MNAFSRAGLAALALTAFLLPASRLAAADPVSLFDGKSLTGWEGDLKWWSVQDGAIMGGSTTEKIPKNFFLATQKSFHNFDLRLKIKLTGTPNTGMINSGVQIRSLRVPGSSEMSGYQVDAGDGWWGKMYDESRRNKVIAESANLTAVNAAVKKDDWNEYRIRTDGPRIQSWINGVPALDYTEPQVDIAQDGHIALQIHSGGIAQVYVKDVMVKELPVTADGPTWDKVGHPKEKKAAAPPATAAPMKEGNASNAKPNTPQQQLKTFKVPDGFEVELVAAEDEAAGIGKFIAVHFDERGRMWSMTALEYPVDGNENPAAAEALYASHAKDKVLVFDTPFAPGPQKPRVFADGLAIPLGILPYKSGCYALHGPDIVYLRDTDGDGNADERDVILTGFGVQDSHLFPHQFTRAPGGWIWMAQGAFNYSQVRRPNESPTRAIQFDQTRMAKFRPDGAGFDITSNGPCNIWGLVLTGEGEAFIQEANDFGYAVMPFHEYANYPGCSGKQWKSYAPEFPSITDFRLGGTGLSGLALTDAKGPFPEPWRDVMLVANPITRKINAVKLRREGTGWKASHLPDFLDSTDEMFRPVAMTLGPDGCVYVVDWYNKIISHNEVPRTHPDRDKVRGRIWRIKPKVQQPFAVKDLTLLSHQELVGMLGGPSVAQSHLVWQTLADRPVEETTPLLDALLNDETKSTAARIQALWVLSEKGQLEAEELRKLFHHPSRNVRREAVRACVYAILQEKDATLLESLEKLQSDTDTEVRAEVVRAAGTLLDALSAAPEQATLRESTLSLLLAFAQAPIAEPTAPSSHNAKKIIKTGLAYEREFERYLVRLALERHQDAVAEFLKVPSGEKLSTEARLLAALSLKATDSVPLVAAILPQLKRPPGSEELLRLTDALSQPEVATAFRAALSDPVKSLPSLEALLEVRSKVDGKQIAPLIVDITRRLLMGDAKQAALGLRLASGFRIAGVSDALAKVLKNQVASSAAPEEIIVTLRALSESGGAETALYLSLAKDSPHIAVRDEATLALAGSKAPEAITATMELLPNVSATQRRLVLDRLATTPAAAKAITAGIQSGAIAKDSLEGNLLERLQTLLPDDAGLKAILKEVASLSREILLLNGEETAWAQTELKFDGPLTAETWVRLDPAGRAPANTDGIFGIPGSIDINFFGGKLRVYGFKDFGDVVVAAKPIVTGTWTHVAASRDASNIWRLYVDGELTATSTRPMPQSLAQPRVGWNTANGGTQGALTGYRVWDVERSGDQIRAFFDRDLPKDTPHLVFNPAAGHDWGTLQKGATLATTMDMPPILSADAAKKLDTSFAKYRTLAEKPGNAANGKLMAAVCMGCHLINGQGGNIGPNLSGVGAMGTEAILRNILTPNAAMESAYRIYRIEMKDGSIKEGFQAGEDANAVVLRVVGIEDQRIPKSEIKHAKFMRRSLMPEGLLEAFPESAITDLFAYLKTLK